MNKLRPSFTRILALLLAVLLPAALWCPAAAQDKGEVVIYTALDRQFSEPILKKFEETSGIKVRPVYDTEAAKTVGLVNRLLAERARPRCDVFWNNEIIRSLQLKHEGLTASYVSPSAASIPATSKDQEGHWTGFAARARVIMVNRKLLPKQDEWPSRVADLTDPKWKGRAAFGKPLFGTTSTHAAVIWAAAGEQKAAEFWKAARENAVMLAGNAQARDAAVSGEVAWCLTDTDDAHGALEDGADVAIVYPLDDPAGKGALLIPNTLVLIKDSPNQENGKRLIDYLLSEAVEKELAASRSAQIPVRASIPGPTGIPPLNEGQVLAVDWEKAYQAIAPSSEFLKHLLNE